MAFKAPDNIIGHFRKRLDTLPQNLKLKKSHVKHIERTKNRLTTSRRQSSAVLSLCQNESNELFQMYLRAGMEDSIQQFLEKQGLDILKSKFFIHTNLQELKRGSPISPLNNIPDDTGTQSVPTVQEEEGNAVLELENSNIPTTHDIVICDVSSNIVTRHNAKLHLNALHLAILSQQGRAVECILKYVLSDNMEEEHKKDILLHILDSKIKLENISGITADINKFSKDDLCLQDMNVFHLSCQFFPKAIEILSEVFGEYLEQRSLPVLETFGTQLKEVVQKKNSSGYTPLHIAAKQSLVETSRTLIYDFKAEVDVEDELGRTPLHYAVQYGNESIISFILKEGNNLNKESDKLLVNKSDKYGITALHLSRTPNIIRLLLDYNADSNATDEKGKDVLAALVEKNDDKGQMAKVLMDNFIEKNEEELDSRHLKLVYNMDFFYPQPKKKKGRERSDGKIKYQNEMSKVARIYDLKSDLLYHPLIQAVTTIKWNGTCQRSKRYASTILKIVFALSLTYLVINPFDHCDDENRIWKREKDLNGTNTTEEDTETKCNSTEQLSVATLSKVIIRGQRYTWYNVLVYIIAFVSAIMLLFRELREFIANAKSYFTRAKNWVELLMIIFTISYLACVRNDAYGISITNIPTRSIKAISIFFAWINIVFMTSSIPKVGIYVHMFMNVSKTLLFFLLIYSPAIIAFALSFRALMPELQSFRNLWTALLKTMAMLVGELDYVDTFIDMSENGYDCGTKGEWGGIYDFYDCGTIIVMQIMSILFLCFGCIVIMNLLVGITVSEIEKLKSEARQISLEEKIYELINDSQRCGSGKQLKRNKAIDEENVEKGREDESLPFLEELRNKKNENGNTITLGNTIKLCVEPNYEHKDETNEEIDQKCYDNWLKFVSYIIPDSLLDKQTNVYFCNGDEKGDYTGFQFSKELIEDTKLCLKSKQEVRVDLERKLQESQLDVVSRRTDEIIQNTTKVLEMQEKQSEILQCLCKNFNNVLNINESQSSKLQNLPTDTN